MQAALDGAGLLVETNGDFLDREFFEVAKEDGLAVLVIMASCKGKSPNPSPDGVGLTIALRMIDDSGLIDDDALTRRNSHIARSRGTSYDREDSLDH